MLPQDQIDAILANVFTVSNAEEPLHANEAGYTEALHEQFRHDDPDEIGPDESILLRVAANMDDDEYVLYDGNIDVMAGTLAECQQGAHMIAGTKLDFTYIGQGMYTSSTYRIVTRA